MPTNEERREVAKRLRKNEPSSFGTIFDVFREIGLAINPKGGSFKVLPLQLANLIEPAKTGLGSSSGVCPKCGGSTYVFCDDYDWWIIKCDACGVTHGFSPDDYIPYGEIENEWKESINAN